MGGWMDPLFFILLARFPTLKIGKRPLLQAMRRGSYLALALALCLLWVEIWVEVCVCVCAMCVCVCVLRDRSDFFFR